VDQDRPYKSFKKYVDRSKEQPKPIEQNFPLRSNHAEVSSSIWTNHYEITLDPKYRLYEYRIDDLTGRNKNKTKKLIKVAIEHLPFLKTNKDKFATDYFSTIIAWKELHADLPEDDLDVSTQSASVPGAVWGSYEIPFGREPTIPIWLKFERVVDTNSQHERFREWRPELGSMAFRRDCQSTKHPDVESYPCPGSF
jgi:hypothetical protein